MNVGTVIADTVYRERVIAANQHGRWLSVLYTTANTTTTGPGWFRWRRDGDYWRMDRWVRRKL
jgi:hypothetical protein